MKPDRIKGLGLKLQTLIRKLFEISKIEEVVFFKAIFLTPWISTTLKINILYNIIFIFVYKKYYLLKKKIISYFLSDDKNVCTCQFFSCTEIIRITDYNQPTKILLLEKLIGWLR